MDIVSILSNAVTQAVGPLAIVYCLAAIGLNLHFGYTGLLNFGQAGFAAIGAYGLGIAVKTLGLNLWLSLLVGIAAAVVLALLLGIPTLRLRADYLSIATIAAAEILRLVVRNSELSKVTGGSNGLNGYGRDFDKLNPFNNATYGFGQITFSRADFFIMIVGWIVVAIFSLLIWALIRSPWGRTLKGIREDEDAVRALGKNVYAFKMQSLIIGGVIGAFAGFIFALATSIQPDNYGTELTFFVYTVLLLGGAARIFGPILGAIIFWAALSLTDGILRGLVDEKIITFLSTSQVGQVRYVLVGVALMLLMIFRPQGILGDKREIAITAR
ncbi:branched-chain amino acid ABC transporter permease [Nakamurella silvestris]|nr:branched-chain amino acid ABC transporter permease [Nakamurella silvestris]